MFGGGTYGPRVFAMIGPCGAVGRLGMNDHVRSGGCQGAGVEIEIAEDESESGEFGVEAGIAEEI